MTGIRNSASATRLRRSAIHFLVRLVVSVAVIAGSTAQGVRAQVPAPTPQPQTPQPQPQPQTPPVTVPPITNPGAPVVIPGVGRPVSQSEILERIRTSGMSREAARQQLVRRGYNAGMLDSYFDVIESSGAGGVQPASLAAPNSDFLTALTNLGITFSATDPTAQDVTPEHKTADQVPVDSTGGGVQVFGRRIFANASTQFTPVTGGPVDASYRLGAGDNLQLILTGEIELAYSLDVNRDGAIIIPQVGQIQVNGLTIGALRNILADRLGRVYSGIQTGATRFDISIGKLRQNQIFMIGDVTAPGSYEVSSLATVFNALYQAQGPNANGSFRNIQVLRGGRVAQVVDLYNYLLNGDTRQDIRLEQGDNVFVPLSGPRVTVIGNVRRPAIFEIKDGETLTDVIRFAGGFSADAFVRTIQIDRIVPPSQRVAGKDRITIDVPLEDALTGKVNIEDGDVVNVFGISQNRGNRIQIRGEVSRPGTYAFQPGMTLWDVVLRAEGLLPDAYHPTAHIIRLNPVTGRYDLQHVELRLNDNGVPVTDVPLQDFDEIVVYGQALLLPKLTVAISGPVNNPSTFPYAAGMTVRDLVLGAGGTKLDILSQRAQISRLRNDGTREVIGLDLDVDSIGIPRNDLVLMPFDSVRLFSRDAILHNAEVTIYGAVRQPAAYPWGEGMTLKDLILRAGGFEKGAKEYEVEVARRASPFVRSDTAQTVFRVALSALDSMSNSLGRVMDVTAPGGWKPQSQEFRLADGDRVFVRQLPGWVDLGTISIDGQVKTPGTYAITTRDMRVSQLIAMAGGLTKQAYVPGFRLERDNLPVAVDLEKATKHPGSRQDIAVRNGDRLVVPEYDGTVLIQGAVPFQARVVYKPGADLDYYIQQAGGFTDYAAKDRVTVTYPSGERRTKHQNIFMTSNPDVKPGSVIYVPVMPTDQRGGTDWGRLLSRTLGVLGTIATLVLAYDRATR
jgi:protein involved in polysaccharide export with SLBB domain